MAECNETLRIAVLMTCHNRKETTLAGLAGLYRQAMRQSAALDVYLVDAGSTDGTPEAVSDAYPTAILMRRGSDVYWTQGTRIAFEKAMSENYDFYLWYNDDVRLETDALQRLLDAYFELRAHSKRDCIVVGALINPTTGAAVYGGYRRTRSLSKVSLVRVPISKHHELVDTMNGNFTLIPSSVARALGNLESKFRQNRGDTDYGLRARNLGFDIWQPEGAFGTCIPTPPSDRWSMDSPSILALWATVIHPKEAPPLETMIFLRRHAGWLWPLIWAKPYLQGFTKTIQWWKHRRGSKCSARATTSQRIGSKN